MDCRPTRTDDFFQLNVISQMALTQHNYVQELLFTEFLGFGAELEKCYLLIYWADVIFMRTE